MKRFVFILVFLVIYLLITIGLYFYPKEQENKETVINEKEITIEDKTEELLNVDEIDEKIIGYITIEKIGLEKAPIANGTDNTTINKYIGHFEESSFLDGNVCLCSHNRGGKGAYFGRLKELQKGDVITYITKYETKQYIVEEIKQIEETDLSVLEPTQNNQITLITCIENIGYLRLCVIGVEK